MIVGIDEVGRGAWAGPLVVGAVLLNDNASAISGLTDSKLLTRAEREVLNREIRERALSIGLGWISAPLVDQMGLTEALKLASRRAIAHIRHAYDEVIIDGNIKFLDGTHVRTIKKADLTIPSVSAASIVAKVARDRYMHHLNEILPGYSFETHVGYGTALHREAIAKLGVTPQHRLSYAPLAKYRQVKARAHRGWKHVLGIELEARGHRILGWPEEIFTIVSIRNGELYFTKMSKNRHKIDTILTEKERAAAYLYVHRNGLYGTSVHFLESTPTATPQTVNVLELS